jgi:hypothetical protein
MRRSRHAGGRRAAAQYPPIESVKLNSFNPQLYLADVLVHVAEHPARHIVEFLFWKWQRAIIDRAAA